MGRLGDGDRLIGRQIGCEPTCMYAGRACSYSRKRARPPEVVAPIRTLQGEVAGALLDPADPRLTSCRKFHVGCEFVCRGASLAGGAGLPVGNQ